MTDILSSFPTDWQDFNALQKARLRDGVWEKQKRQHPDLRIQGIASTTREVYRDTRTHVHYAITTDKLYNQAVDVRSYHAYQKRAAERELSCFEYAPYFGVKVPSQFSMAETFDTGPLHDDAECRAVFKTALATSEVNGKSVQELCFNRITDETKRHTLMNEWALQSISLFFAYGDPERAVAKNVIVEDYEQETPQSYVHIDFEDVRRDFPQDMYEPMLKNFERCYRQWTDNKGSLKKLDVLIRLAETSAKLVRHQSRLEPDHRDDMEKRLQHGISLLQHGAWTL